MAVTNAVGLDIHFFLDVDHKYSYEFCLKLYVFTITNMSTVELINVVKLKSVLLKIVHISG
jgi:hypothetical protein